MMSRLQSGLGGNRNREMAVIRRCSRFGAIIRVNPYRGSFLFVFTGRWRARASLFWRVFALVGRVQLDPVKALEFLGEDVLGSGFGPFVPSGLALAGNWWLDETVGSLGPFQGAFRWRCYPQGVGLAASALGFFLRPFGPFGFGGLSVAPRRARGRSSRAVRLELPSGVAAPNRARATDRSIKSRRLA
jgi:hypothetical protein